MGESFESWWAKLGLVTKITLIVPLVLTCAFEFGLVNPMLYVTNWNAFLYELHLWRPITSAMFLGKFGMAFLMELAMLVMYTQRHEEYYEGKKADLIWMITVFLVAANVIGGISMGMMVLSGIYIFAMVWVFCKRHEDAKMSLWFFEFSGKVFPWVFLAFTVMMKKYTIVEGLTGLAIGHIFFFLTDVFPRTHGKTLLATPAIFRQWFPDERIGRGVYTNIPQARQPQQDPGAHRWGGGGRALGGGN